MFQIPEGPGAEKATKGGLYLLCQNEEKEKRKKATHI
jgi:hypothetical protein